MMELDREQFRSWLVAKDPKEPVGFMGHAKQCPIAQYLKDSNGWASAWVTGGTYGRAALEGSHPSLPQWARQFVHLIDENFEPTALAEALCNSVTAKKALTLLDDIDFSEDADVQA